jgi:uncharacterized protein with NRDE domain
MCLVVLGLEVSDRYALLFCANRDERHARPSAAAGWWKDHPQILGGRDLVAGGSWLAVDRRGRLAAVTNLRDPGGGAPIGVAPRSRGVLVANYLAGMQPLDEFAAETARDAAEYGPFSLLLLDGADLRCVSNLAPASRLGQGVHALSNAAYGVEWPKVRSARRGLENLLDARAPLEGLFELLAQRSPAEPGERLYRTAHFIAGETYGTRSSTVVLRSSTVVLIDRDGVVTFAERSFDAAARLTGEQRYTFRAEPAR